MGRLIMGIVGGMGAGANHKWACGRDGGYPWEVQTSLSKATCLCCLKLVLCDLRAPLIMDCINNNFHVWF